MKNLLRLATFLLLIAILVVLAKHRMKQGNPMEITNGTNNLSIGADAMSNAKHGLNNVFLSRKAKATDRHGALLEPDNESISGEETDKPMTPEEVDAQLELLP